MVTIGIIGAMEEEIAYIKEKMQIVSVKNIVGVDFQIGTMHGKSIVLARSGIGKVNAALCTQVLVDLYGVDYIINIGVAGGVDRELSVGDVVISSEVCQHDFDCTGFGHEPGVIPRMAESMFKADNALVKLAKTSADMLVGDNKAISGRIVSGDQFVAKKEDTKRIWDIFKASCVEMEGGAVAQAAYLNQVPFVIIRTISDNADEEANSDFAKFVETSAKRSALIIDEMIKGL